MEIAFFAKLFALLAALMVVSIAGMKPNAYKKNPLHTAIEQEHLQTITQCINEGASVNAQDLDGDTPLHKAATRGNLNILNILIQAGAAINTKNHAVNSPLHNAIHGNHQPSIAVLVKAGADINAKNCTYTPLDYALILAHENAAHTLITAGADVNIHDDYGDTPLHIVAKKGYQNLVEALLVNQANINKKNNNGDTPLHEACRYNHSAVARHLIEAGADINSHDNSGLTPLDKASQHKDIVRCLVTQGGYSLLYNHVTFSKQSILMQENCYPTNWCVKTALEEDFINIPLYTLLVPRNISGVQKILQTNPNLIHSHDREFGATLLMYAAALGLPAIVDLLLEAGANPMLRTDKDKHEDKTVFDILFAILKKADLPTHKKLCYEKIIHWCRVAAWQCLSLPKQLSIPREVCREIFYCVLNSTIIHFKPCQPVETPPFIRKKQEMWHTTKIMTFITAIARACLNYHWNTRYTPKKN